MLSSDVISKSVNMIEVGQMFNWFLIRYNSVPVLMCRIFLDFLSDRDKGKLYSPLLNSALLHYTQHFSVLPYSYVMKPNDLFVGNKTILWCLGNYNLFVIFYRSRL